MTRRVLAHIALLTIAVALTLSPGLSAGIGGPEHQDTAPQAPSASSMLSAWQTLAGALDAYQMQAASFAFADARRHEWFYTPVDRVGLRIGDLDTGQMNKLLTFLNNGLGESGTETAFEVVQLEEVLFSNSGGREMRNPGNYYLMMFGNPTARGAWGWRFEGHHLSTSFTVVDGLLVSGTPAFFGGNPAHVPGDSTVHAGLNPFDREHDLGFQLIDAFDDEQRSRVILDVEAPSDILTTNSQRAEMGPPEGMSIADMSEAQRALVRELMGVYGRRMDPALLDYQMAKIRQAGVERVHFAWAGGTRPGEGHYYRIQGPTFVIEYDNTQNDANHVHSVWRDFEDDFGYDPLRQHLAADHSPGVLPIDTKPSVDLGNDREIEDHEQAHRRAHAGGAAHSHLHRRADGSTSR